MEERIKISGVYRKWKKQVKIGLIILAGCVAIIIEYNIIKNTYMPVRFMSIRPPLVVGGIDNDGSAIALFTLKNYSRREQNVYFLVYQHNNQTDKRELFDIEHMYYFIGVGNQEEIANGVLTIPGGESRDMCIEAQARDSSKVLSSRGAPEVEIIVLNY